MGIDAIEVAKQLWDETERRRNGRMAQDRTP
jgi:hypothetical protein